MEPPELRKIRVKGWQWPIPLLLFFGMWNYSPAQAMIGSLLLLSLIINFLVIAIHALESDLQRAPFPENWKRQMIRRGFYVGESMGIALSLWWFREERDWGILPLHFISGLGFGIIGSAFGMLTYYFRRSIHGAGASSKA